MSSSWARSSIARSIRKPHWCSTTVVSSRPIRSEEPPATKRKSARSGAFSLLQRVGLELVAHRQEAHDRVDRQAGAGVSGATSGCRQVGGDIGIGLERDVRHRQTDRPVLVEVVGTAHAQHRRPRGAQAGGGLGGGDGAIGVLARQGALEAIGQFDVVVPDIGNTGTDEGTEGAVGIAEEPLGDDRRAPLLGATDLADAGDGAGAVEVELGRNAQVGGQREVVGEEVGEGDTQGIGLRDGGTGTSDGTSADAVILGQHIAGILRGQVEPADVDDVAASALRHDRCSEGCHDGQGGDFGQEGNVFLHCCLHWLRAVPDFLSPDAGM